MDARSKTFGSATCFPVFYYGSNPPEQPAFDPIFPVGHKPQERVPQRPKPGGTPNPLRHIIGGCPKPPTRPVNPTATSEGKLVAKDRRSAPPSRPHPPHTLQSYLPQLPEPSAPSHNQSHNQKPAPSHPTRPIQVPNAHTNFERKPNA